MKKILFTPLVTAISVSSMFFASCGSPSGPVVNNQGQVSVARPSNSLMQQGLKEFATIKSKKRISRNSSYNAQTQRVASRLKRVINLPGARWEFVVFDDPTPNAFALPGGKVGIHTGLFQITQNDAGLAAVVGHEIAHVTRNHAGSRMKQRTGLAVLGAVLDQVAKGQGASGTDRAKIGAAYGGLATVGLALPHSRRAELEADKIGAVYMAKAGYNPQEAVNLWKRFSAYKAKKGKRQPEFLSTHPLDSTRINALQAFMPTAMKSYKR